MLYIVHSDSEETPELLTEYLENVLVPIPFNNASLKDDYVEGQILTTEDFRDGAAGGVALTALQSLSVNALVDALGPCTSDNNNPVVVNVTGYASSLPFDEYDPPMSDELNRQVANLRADNVANGICQSVLAANTAGQVNLQNFRVDLVQHLNPTAMHQDRPFDDRPPGAGEGNASETLNRTALIRVVSAGTCNRSESQAALDLDELPQCEIDIPERSVVNTAR